MLKNSVHRSDYVIINGHVGIFKDINSESPLAVFHLNWIRQLVVFYLDFEFIILNETIVSISPVISFYFVEIEYMQIMNIYKITCAYMALAAMIFLLRLGHFYIMRISWHGKAVEITGRFSREYNSDRWIPFFPVTGGFSSQGNSYTSFNVCISMSIWTSCWIKKRVSGVLQLHDAHLPHCNINNGAGLHRMTPYIRIYTYIHTYISYVYIFRNYTRQYTCNYRYICILHH